MYIPHSTPGKHIFNGPLSAELKFRENTGKSLRKFLRLYFVIKFVLFLLHNSTGSFNCVWIKMLIDDLSAELTEKQ